MTLYALKEEDLIYAPENKERGQFTCKDCHQEMLFVDAIMKTKHFRHKNTECPYETEPETEEHLYMKKYFKEHIPTAQIEQVIGTRRTDVLIGDVVIECQCSPLSMKEFLQRTKDYNNQRKWVIWVFYNDKLFKPEDDWMHGEQLYRFKAIERLFHYCTGELYFLNKRDGTIEGYRFKDRDGKTQSKLEKISLFNGNELKFKKQVKETKGWEGIFEKLYLAKIAPVYG